MPAGSTAHPTRCPSTYVFSEWTDNRKSAERGDTPEAGLARQEEEDRGKAVHETARECSEDEEDLPQAK